MLRSVRHAQLTPLPRPRLSPRAASHAPHTPNALLAHYHSSSVHALVYGLQPAALHDSAHTLDGNDARLPPLGYTPSGHSRGLFVSAAMSRSAWAQHHSMLSTWDSPLRPRTLGNVRYAQPSVATLQVRSYSREAAPHDQYHVNPILTEHRRRGSDPAIAVVQDIRNCPRSRAFKKTLKSSTIPMEEYKLWEAAVRASSLSTALDRAQDILASQQASPDAPPSPDDTRPGALPPWVVLALLCKEPTNELQAFVLHRLVLAQPFSRAPEISVLTHTLAALWFTKLRMYALLQLTAARLARHRKYLRFHQAALLLRLLAHAPPSRAVQLAIAPLLEAATRARLELGTSTYRALLENRAATGTMALAVEKHMFGLDYVPNLAHCRAFVRVYARAGRRRQSARFWRRIRKGEFFGQVPQAVELHKFQKKVLWDHLRAFRGTQKVQMYVRYLAKNAARAREGRAPGAEPPVPGALMERPALSRADDVSKTVWVRILATAAKDAKIGTADLLALLARGRALIKNRELNALAAVLVLKGLLRRGAYEEAAPLLDHALGKKEYLEIAQLTVLAEALTLLGRPAYAFRLLRSLAAPESQPVAEPESEPGTTAETDPASSNAPKKAKIDTAAVNAFMAALLRTGRPDAVFYLWDTLPRIFGPAVQPNAETLALLLQAARVARKCEGALQVALQDFGLRHVLPAGVGTPPLERAPQTLGEQEAVEGLEGLLERREGRVTGFWRGERAGVVALRLAWRVFVGSWPALEGLRPPVRAVRGSAEEQALSPVADLYHSVHGAPVEDSGFGAGLDGEEGGGGGFPADEDGRTYFGVVPHDGAFRALLDLLAEERRTAQVPRVLAWMRFLRVRPSKDTLAAAFVYWGEVALEGPLIERWKGDRGSEYGRLVRWVEEWVGGRGVPGREEMQRALRRVRWFRDMPAVGAGGRPGEGLREEFEEVEED